MTIYRPQLKRLRTEDSILSLGTETTRFNQHPSVKRSSIKPRKHIGDHYPKSHHPPAQALNHSSLHPRIPSLAEFSDFSYSSCSASYVTQKQPKCIGPSTFTKINRLIRFRKDLEYLTPQKSRVLYGMSLRGQNIFEVRHCIL